MTQDCHLDKDLSISMKFHLDVPGGQFDEAIITFKDGATEGHDPCCDAFQMYPKPYSMVSICSYSSDSFMYTINTYPKLKKSGGMEEVVLDGYIRVNSSKFYNLDIVYINNFDFSKCNIKIRDLHTFAETPIKENDSAVTLYMVNNLDSTIEPTHQFLFQFTKTAPLIIRDTITIVDTVYDKIFFQIPSKEVKEITTLQLLELGNDIMYYNFMGQLVSHMSSVGMYYVVWKEDEEFKIVKYYNSYSNELNDHY